ncbi:MAG: hypothetical protein K1X85_10205 [Ignavibacteria bacterium]|nr:hypothetical protein [Ignavibacteria bacterium]
MTDTKLTNILRSLTLEEMKQFEKFVASSFHNKGRDLIHLLKALRAFYPEFNHKNLTNEFLFRKIFPGKYFDEVRSGNLIRTLTSHLFRMCKDFLVQVELENQSAAKKYLLLNQLRKRRLYKDFDKEFDNRKNADEDISKGSVGYFVNEFLINAVKRDCSLNRDDFGNAVEYTIKASEKILTAALISCFKFEDEKTLAEAYNIPIRNNLIQVVIDNLNFDELLPSVKKNDPENFAYVEIFHAIYLTNKYRNNNAYYYSLKELLIKHEAIFGKAEKYVLWNILLTYCGINRLGSQEVFQIHKHILEKEIYKLPESENFHIVLFRNIVITSSSIGEYKWLEEFIDKYSGELHEYHRENMKAYSMAYLHFARAEYEEALGYILKIKYNLFLFKLDLKILQLKLYYELGYYEEGLSLVATTLSYLNSTDELAPIVKQSIGEFAKCLRELIKVRISTKVKKEDIIAGTERARKIMYPSLSEWLIEKIGKAEGK